MNILSITAIVIISLGIKKKCCTSFDILGLNFDTVNIVEERENFFTSTLWLHDRKFRYKSRSRYLYFDILLLLCGDIEQCPGPGNLRSNPDLERITSLKGLRLFHHNVRGLWNNINNITELCSSFKNIDVLTLSETHTNITEPEELFKLNNYSFVRRDRTKGIGGGVAAYISNKFVEGEHWKRREDLENNVIEALWLEIMPPKSKSFLICIVYRPLANSKYLHPNFCEIFYESLSNANKHCNEMIVMGDINVII